MSLLDLLLVADGRAPVGSYAHSFGLESAAATGDVHDVPSLAAFAGTRARTSGSVDAAFAAAVCHRTRVAGAGTHATDHHPADTEYHARVAAPAVRDASRALGRHLLRMAVRVWPSAPLDDLARTGPAAAGGPGWHHPIVLGVVAGSRRASDEEVATVALYGLVSAIASAGVRLLGLDPVEVHGLQAKLADDIDRLAAAAAASADGPLAALPATSTPLVDIRAQRHAHDATARLFAS